MVRSSARGGAVFRRDARGLPVPDGKRGATGGRDGRGGTGAPGRASLGGRGATTERIAIQNEVRAAAQKLLDDYRVGVLLSTVNIESAAPPPEAAEAFRDVASARADTSRIVSQAQGYANDLIPRARGQAQQLFEEAAGYRQRKIDEANGDASRFNQVAAEYDRAAQVTRRRLYLEAMEEVLPRIRKLIVDPAGNLDLTIIRKGDAPAGAKR